MKLFSMQATLLKSGDIIFAYKDIPISVTTIGDEAHPVKVGVSDAYIIDRTIFCKSLSLESVCQTKIIYLKFFFL